MWAIIVALVALCSGLLATILAGIVPLKSAFPLVERFCPGRLTWNSGELAYCHCAWSGIPGFAEGAFAMGVMFTIAPLGGLLGGVILVLIRLLRTDQAVEDGRDQIN